jgi:aspartyl-tRNA(Asn)/glutamyl-tRNA(Gln) amidotransferase subunit A
VRIGVPRAVFYEKLDAQVERAVGEALRVLAKATAGMREVTLPPLPVSPELADLPLTYSRIITAEAHAYHQDRLQQRPELFHAGTRRSIENGARVSAADYIRARLEMDRLRRESGRLFTDADVLVTPASPAPAFELGSKPTLVFLRNLAPWNLYGLPSIAIPCGFSTSGLPLGLQITGPAGADSTVLAVAEAYQRLTDWHTRRPA